MTIMQFKRAICLALCLVSVLSCFVGCGNTADTSGAGSDTQSDAGNTTTTPDGVVEVKSGIVTPGAYYINPLEASAADPQIIKHGDTYYLYSTGGTTLSVRSSTNLSTWEDKKTIFRLSDTTWGVDRCWAPEVHEYKGKFYLFFCGRDSKQIFHGSVAVSDTPDGEFVPITSEPLLNFSYSVIDLSFFEDDDGRTYIFYSKDCSTNKINGKGVSQSYGVEVSNDFTTLIGDPVLISTPTEAWEKVSGSTTWNEGPVVFKENGKYYLLYSANYYESKDYSVGYCVSDTPLAFYEKPKNGCILKGNGETITGSGHCNILRIEDEIYLTYHSHTKPPNNDNGRSLYIDKLIVADDGTLYANGPTNTRQPMPNGVNGYYKYAGDIEISGNLTTAQDLNILIDDKLPKGFANHVTFADNDSVTFKFPEAQDVSLVWVYPTTVTSYKTASVSILVNGKYLYKGVKFLSAGGAAVVSLDKLPEGTNVSDITLSFTKADGSECAAIGEVVFTLKK